VKYFDNAKPGQEVEAEGNAPLVLVNEQRQGAEPRPAGGFDPIFASLH